MTPGELSRIEDTLRRAYGDVLESVRRDGSSPELMPGFQPGRPGRRFGRPGRAGSSRRLVPVAAAAAVAVIALVAGLIVPGALRPAAAPAVHLGYVRASVINGCRLVHRARTRSLRLHSQFRPDQPVAWSAESAVLAREESRLALQAVARLRGRAREVLAMRYLLDMSDGEIAAALGVSKGTVSSTASRALAALARTLKEQS